VISTASFAGANESPGEQKETEPAGPAHGPTFVVTSDRDRLLSSAAEALKGLLSSDDFDAAVAEALRQVGQAARLHRVKVILPRRPREGEAPSHDLTYEWWDPSFESQASFGASHFPDALTEADYLVPLRAGLSIFQFIEEVQPALRASFEMVGMRSMGIVPILIGTEYAGMVAFDDCVERRVFSTGEMDALAITGRAIGAAVYRRQMQNREAHQASVLSATNAALTAALAKIETHAEQLQLANDAIRSTASRLAVEPSLDAFLGVLLCELARALGTGTAALTPYDPESDTLFVAAAVHEGALAPLDPTPPRFRASEYPAWAALCESRGPLICDLERDHTLGWPGGVELLRSRGYKASVTVPIRSGAVTIGQMAFAYPDIPTFNEAQRTTIDVFCHQAALALELTRLAVRAKSAAAERAVIEERNRMAGEIHDSLAQSFTSIALQTESIIARLIEDAPLRATLELIEATARLGLAEARSSVLALRPIGDAVGELYNALAQLAERCTIAGAVICEFTPEAKPCALPADVRDAVLRVSQEAVTNALRHARCGRIVIVLDVKDGHVRLSVEDDGEGLASVLAPGRSGFGLDGMRARAQALGGHLTIANSKSGRGTVVEMIVPCNSEVRA